MKNMTVTMKRMIQSGILFMLMMAVCVTTSYAAEKQQQGANQRLENRIDFGNSYILGQSIKSGAVYLLQRKKSDINSMLHVRENYRKEILEDFTVNDLSMDDKKGNSKKEK